MRPKDTIVHIIYDCQDVLMCKSGLTNGLDFGFGDTQDPHDNISRVLVAMWASMAQSIEIKGPGRIQLYNEGVASLQAESQAGTVGLTW